MPDQLLALKSFCTLEVKDAETGAVEAIIATLGVVDKDEDIIRSDAIPNGAKVSMSAYGHDAVFGTAPVGKGAIFVEGNELRFKGRMFLATTRGRETFETLKEMGGDQEWSFGFRILGSEVPSDSERKAGARRILTKLDAFEVSPVIVGAGVGTRTVGVKGAAPNVDAAMAILAQSCAAACRACAEVCDGYVAGTVSMADCMAACEACSDSCELMTEEEDVIDSTLGMSGDGKAAKPTEAELAAQAEHVRDAALERRFARGIPAR